MTARVYQPGEIRSRLPATQPRTVEQALSLLGIGHRLNFKGEPKHAIRPLQLIGRCPFHHDRKASFSIRDDDGTWYCFAGCGGGNLAQLVERVCAVPRFMAEKWILGIDSMWRPVAGVPPELVAYDENEYRDKFTCPPRWALEERGISRVAARKLAIRWCRDRSAWVLPVWHPDTGGLMGWQYKSADYTWCEDGTPKSRTLFGIDVFEPRSTAILVESPLDVAVLLTAGLDGGLASFGVGVSHAQLQILAVRARQIVIAMDNDEAGRGAHDKLIKAPEFAGKRLLQFNYAVDPAAKDPGEMEDDALREAIRTAKRLR
jgi:hypothetical protein